MTDSWREIEAVWQGGQAFIGSNLTGGNVQIGSIDGKFGLSAMELLLAGLAGCTGADVVSILNKKRLSLDNLVIKVQGKRAEDHPRVFTEIKILYSIWGQDIDEKSVDQAIRLSHEKYCSASAMLGCSAEIDFSYKINRD